METENGPVGTDPEGRITEEEGTKYSDSKGGEESITGG